MPATDYVAFISSSRASHVLPCVSCWSLPFLSTHTGAPWEASCHGHPTLDTSLGSPRVMYEGQPILAFFLSPQTNTNTLPSSTSFKDLQQAMSGVRKWDRSSCLGWAWRQLLASPQISPGEPVAAYGVGSLHWDGGALFWGNEYQYQTAKAEQGKAWKGSESLQRKWPSGVHSTGVCEIVQTSGTQKPCGLPVVLPTPHSHTGGCSTSALACSPL